MALHRKLTAADLKAQVLFISGDDWYPPAWSAVVLLAMLMYIAAYAFGLGNVPWQQGELFNLEGECLQAV